jgi:hypothetical protein
MPVSLSKVHRKLLENTTAAARVLAESACRAALENLAVHEKEARKHMSAEQRQLRNRLRARGRAIGDARDIRTGLQDIHHLTELAAYEHWHRLLFTRFLTENHLLITDEANGSVPITMEECEELAAELGARDGLDLACRFASRTLPGVFRRDDSVLDLPLALNDQVELRKLLASLPSECFRADDALGWTYQFWQAQRKDEINDSGKKIGADELAPVTQLFTEDYMVLFLLHNTLGAWWVGKRRAEGREWRISGYEWTYLKLNEDGTAAAGSFESWPKAAKHIKVLDPCEGSGHFIVFALPILVAFRMEEEGLSIEQAVEAVLRDNLFGLELDLRCTQIAAFNLALAAWRMVGYRKLPQLNVACTGLGINAREEDWVRIAGNEERLRGAMSALYGLFQQAQVLGSLIDPKRIGGSLFVAEFEKVQRLVESALASEQSDEAAHELAVTAQGLVKAVRILADSFTLVATNVPYLGQRKQGPVLEDYCERFHPRAKADLATCFIERCLALCEKGGAIALVTPQNWLFLSSYKSLRQSLLEEHSLRAVIRLGPGAFETIGGEVVNVALFIGVKSKPEETSCLWSLDVSEAKSPEAKAQGLRLTSGLTIGQRSQLKNPDYRITGAQPREDGTLLERFTISPQGIKTGDDSKWRGCFWEFCPVPAGWRFYQSPVEQDMAYGGREHVIDWRTGGTGMVRPRLGNEAVGKIGVGISAVGKLVASIYTGEHYDSGVATIVPVKSEHLPAVWTFCSSPEFRLAVRQIDKKVAVTNMTLVKVPFDLNFWQHEANQKYPDGLPTPYSADPTQWLFNGHPGGSTQPLHVAVARLLGYQWPRQTGSSFNGCPALKPDGLEMFADEGGIVCLPPVNREQPAAGRLRQLLNASLGAFDERSLVASAGLRGSESKTIEDWLRDEFFEQHAKLFHDRPFVWHLWDGRQDGFHALVNYHRLDHANLQKLTYVYLGDWIRQQAEDTKADKPGAAGRLGAARALQSRLAAILEGEAPLDIFVRWKPLKEQAEGWRTDLNDGVRQNIRPFLLANDVGKRGAGLFRTVPLSLKDRDRGAEPHRPKKDYPWFWCEEEPGTDPKGGKDFVGNRWNDVHLTLEAKQKARA